MNWLPTYLRTDRGMAFVAGSMLSAVPFLAADAGNLGGGAASRWLARRGLGATRGRAAVMAGCVLLIAPGAAVGSVRNDVLVLALLAVMALGTAAFMANYFAFCQEVDPRRTGLVVGILGALGNLFAAGFAPIVGWVKDTTGGFGPVFLVVGLLPIVGLRRPLLLGWGEDGARPPSRRKPPRRPRRGLTRCDRPTSRGADVPRTHPGLFASRAGRTRPALGPTRMKSRLSRLGVLTVAACLGLLGCEHWRNGLRKDGADSSTAKAANPEFSVPASEHGPGGKSGMLSSQARDIEKDFNYR